MNTTTFDRNAVLETLKASCEPRVMEWMNKLRTALIAIGATCGTVKDTSVDVYKWSLDVSFIGNDDNTPRKLCVNKDIGFDFEIVEGLEYDGEEAEKGINFFFRGIYWGGRVFGLSIEPGNYTTACWVDMTDNQAVEQRFMAVLSNNPTDVAAAIKAEWEENHA